MLHQSYPSGTSWNCAAGEDYGSGNTFKSVYAYAICTTYKSNVPYIDNPVTKHNQVEGKGSGKYTASAIATCADDMFVTGGGCISTTTNGGNHPWRLSNSYPQGNSWICDMGEDYGSKDYDEEITAYALCISFQQ